MNNINEFYTQRAVGLIATNHYKINCADKQIERECNLNKTEVSKRKPIEMDFPAN